MCINGKGRYVQQPDNNSPSTAATAFFVANDPVTTGQYLCVSKPPPLEHSLPNQIMEFNGTTAPYTLAIVLFDGEKFDPYSATQQLAI